MRFLWQLLLVYLLCNFFFKAFSLIAKFVFVKRKGFKRTANFKHSTHTPRSGSQWDYRRVIDAEFEEIEE